MNSEGVHFLKGLYLNDVPALFLCFRAQNGFKLFALFCLESLDSSRSLLPYEPENMTSNKLQTWQDHDVRNLMAEFILDTNYLSETSYPSETDNSFMYKFGTKTNYGAKFV